MSRGVLRAAIPACLTMAAMVFSGGPARAADWQNELTREILHDLDCKVSFMSQVMERTVNGRHIISAKVHCQDERSFDALRDSHDKAFQFKACEVPNAETC